MGPARAAGRRPPPGSAGRPSPSRTAALARSRRGTTGAAAKALRHCCAACALTGWAAPLPPEPGKALCHWTALVVARVPDCAVPRATLASPGPRPPGHPPASGHIWRRRGWPRLGADGTAKAGVRTRGSGEAACLRVGAGREGSRRRRGLGRDPSRRGQAGCHPRRSHACLSYSLEERHSSDSPSLLPAARPPRPGVGLAVRGHRAGPGLERRGSV
jgi:hypothetical protein